MGASASGRYSRLARAGQLCAEPYGAARVWGWAHAEAGALWGCFFGEACFEVRWEMPKDRKPPVP